MNLLRVMAISFAVFMVAGCAPPNFEPRRLAQSDTQLVLERVRFQLDEDLVQLTRKLYARNPDQLSASGFTLDQRLRMLRQVARFEELEQNRSASAVRLAFDPSFNGDRVFAFVYGLASMIDDSYGRKREFYLLEGAPPAEGIVNSARNVETATYLLRTARRADGQPYLLADGVQDGVLNASFSQLLGRIGAKQDVIADMVGDKEQRQVNAVARSVFTSVFLPIPF